MKKRILTITDGNGVDVGFKKWPFYLKLLTTKTLDVVNKSTIGASNEFIFLTLAETLNVENFDYAVIQWSNPQRLDLVASEFWQDQANVDDTYAFNMHELLGNKWWVSSASENKLIRDYHDLYINYWHAQQRTQTLMLAAAELLNSKNIKFAFSLCYEMSFVDPTKNILDGYSWVWHERNKGLSEFREHSKFSNFDTGLPQPHTLIHLDWINTVLKPACHFIDFDSTTYYNIENHLLSHV